MAITGTKAVSQCDTQCQDKKTDPIRGHAVPKCYESVICSDKDQRALELAIQTGKSVKMDYYHLQLAEDDPLFYADAYISPGYQTYVKLKEYPGLSESGVQTQIDPTNNLATGSLTIKVPGTLFLPVKGDMAVIKTSGRYHLWAVTQVQATGINPDTTWYEVELTLQSEVNATNAEYNTLQDKTIETYLYQDGKLITEEGIKLQAGVTIQQEDGLALWRDRFVACQSGFTKEGKFIYDPEFSRFTHALFPVACASSSKDVFFGKASSTTIIDALLSPSLYKSTPLCPKRCIYPIGKYDASFTPVMRARAFSGFIVGKDYPSYRESEQRPNPCGQFFHTDTTEGCMDIDDPICYCGKDDPENDLNTDYGRLTTVNGESVALIHNPIGQTYLFSEHFYKKDVNNMSYLERMVLRYLQQEDIAVSDLVPLWEDVIHWCSHSYYYFIPILYLLSNYAKSKRKLCNA
jgi:hypothetical protein